MSAEQQQTFYATGKRKTSAARVFLRPGGSGKITINKRSMQDYVQTASGRVSVVSPLVLTDTKSKVDLYVTVKGGGTTGQVEAIRHGIAKVLLVFEESFRGKLKKAGFLTRDSRMVERKKYGLHKARKSSQFSKR